MSHHKTSHRTFGESLFLGALALALFAVVVLAVLA